MSVFKILRKSDGAEVYEYQDDAPAEWFDFPFSDFDHIEQSAVDPIPGDPQVWRIYVGAFFDRFGAAKLPILSSTDPIVEALIKDASVRQYIALTERRDELAQMLALLQSRIEGISLDPVAILDLEPTAYEAFNG